MRIHSNPVRQRAGASQGAPVTDQTSPISSSALLPKAGYGHSFARLAAPPPRVRVDVQQTLQSEGDEQAQPVQKRDDASQPSRRSVTQAGRARRFGSRGPQRAAAGSGDAPVQRLMSSGDFSKNAKRAGIRGVISNWTSTTRATMTNLLKEYEAFKADETPKGLRRRYEILTALKSLAETWVVERYEVETNTEEKPETVEDVSEFTKNSQEMLSGLDKDDKARIDTRKDTDAIMQVVVQLLGQCHEELMNPKLENIESGEADDDNYVPAGVTGKAAKNLKELHKTNKKKQKVITDRLEGSPDTVFGNVLPKLLDTVMVPSTGDKTSITITLVFPVAVEPHTMTTFGIGGRVLLDAERKEDAQIKVLFEGALRGQVSVAAGHLKANVELGVYFEAQAKDSKNVGRLLSYALYQRFRESKKIPAFATNTLWGGSSGGLGKSRAERFAGAVEEQVFGDDKEKRGKDTYIETGGFGGVGIQAGVGDIAKIQGGVKGYHGMRYDTDSLEKTGKLVKKDGKYQSVPRSILEERKKTEQPNSTKKLTVGKGARRLEIAGQAKFMGVQADGKFKIELLADPGHRNMGMGGLNKKTGIGGFHKWELDCSAEVTVPGGSGLANVAQMLLSAEQLVTTVSNQLNEVSKSDPETTRQVGGALSELLNTEGAIANLASTIPGGDKIAHALSAAGNTGLRLRVKPSVDTGKPLKIEIYLYLVHNLAVPEGIGGGVVDVTAKFAQGKRLAYFKYQGGAWNLESLGVSVEEKPTMVKDSAGKDTKEVEKKTTTFKSFGSDKQYEKNMKTGKTTLVEKNSRSFGEKMKAKQKK